MLLLRTLLSPSQTTEYVSRSKETILVTERTKSVELDKRSSFPGTMWICLMLACLGAAWFSYHYFLIPQPQSFPPDWHGAQWIQAPSDGASVSYFRSSIFLDAIPQTGSVTIVASQVFRLYVNGVFIGSNDKQFAHGNALRPSIYDVSQLLHSGKNVIAVRVAHMDQQKPALRASLHTGIGKARHSYITNARWQATSQSSVVFPRSAQISDAWASVDFDARGWKSAQQLADVPTVLPLLVSPLLYGHTLPAKWKSVRNSQHGYFLWQLRLSSAIPTAWLRLTATGSASVIVNGHLSFIWNGQPPASLGQRAAHLGTLPNIFDNDITSTYPEANGSQIPGYTIGVQNIAPYLHSGVNTIAIQVITPSVSPLLQNRPKQPVALTADLLTADAQGHTRWYTEMEGWRGSTLVVEGWERGNDASLVWPSPTLIDMPDMSHRFAIPESDTLAQSHSSLNAASIANGQPLKWCLFRGNPVPRQTTQEYCGPLDPRNFQPFSIGLNTVSISLACQAIVGSVLVILLPWFLLSAIVGRRVFGSTRTALETLSLAYLPALAVESVLVVLSLEPLMPQPFPYTSFWGLMLIGLVAAGYFALFLNAAWSTKRFATAIGTMPVRENNGVAADQEAIFDDHRWRSIVLSVLCWLRLHWPLPLLMLIAIPLICYDIRYEPYWQDELVSFYAAKAILAHGHPMWPSGVAYPKGELYSYMLATVMFFFGDQGNAPRMLSALEFLISIPLFYLVGCYFFNRRVAALAVAMLVLSPYAFTWARQVRMYQQAQLMVSCVLFLFHKAVQEKQHARFIYIAIGILVLAYLSHEQLYIILPAIVCCVLLISKDSKHLLPSVIYHKHWWFASFIGTGCIGMQLLIVHLTNPAALGTDHTMRPPVQLTTDNLHFYINMFLFQLGQYPLLTLSTILAIVGYMWALRSRNSRAWYCAVFLIISTLTLVFLLTMRTTRYFYPILTIYYLMAAYGFVSTLQALWYFACPRLAQHPMGQKEEHQRNSIVARPIKMFVGGTVALVYATVLILPMLPISDYNLFVSRIARIEHHRHWGDYDTAGGYIQQHKQNGDIIVSMTPAILMYHYAGQSDYFLSFDRALLRLEQNGHIVNKTTGAIVLLNQADLQSILSSHSRIWLISDGGRYQLENRERFSLPADFHVVYEGYGSVVYLRDVKW